MKDLCLLSIKMIPAVNNETMKTLKSGNLPHFGGQESQCYTSGKCYNQEKLKLCSCFLRAHRCFREGGSLKIDI